MRFLNLLFIFTLFTSAYTANAEGERVAVFSCAYKMMGTDFAQIQLGLLADGQTEDYVTVIHYGKSHREGITHVERKPDEEMHFWISKESKDSSIEVIVFLEPRKTGKSVMINPHIPFGREMWGNCTTDVPKL